MLRYSVDAITCERVRGWAHDDEPEAVVEIAVAVDGREVGRVGTRAFRPDVVDALGDPRAAHSGFEVAIPREALAASPGPHAEVSVHIGGREVVRSPVPVIGTVEPRTGPLPPDVMGLLIAFRPEYATATWDDGTARSAVDDLAFLLARGPQPARGLHQYLATIAQLWVRAAFVELFFPTENEQAAVDAKDRSAVQNSAVEVFAIAAHLVNLHAQGLTGAFAEFGCFKGFSTAILSDVCHQLGITMHVFDSFEGLPPSDSEYYRAGDFAGSLPEVQANLTTYGRPQPVVFHQGFFADTLPTVDLPPLVALWMDVDLESSARDVMPALAKLDPRGVLFSHECPASLFADGTASAPRSPDQVVPPILDGFAALGRPVAARHVAGNTGAFWDAERGIAPLPTDALLALRDLALAVVATPPSPVAPPTLPPRRRRLGRWR